MQCALSEVSCDLPRDSEYGKKDALIDYALHVMRNGLEVRRAEIPRDKSTCLRCNLPRSTTFSSSH